MHNMKETLIIFDVDNTLCRCTIKGAKDCPTKAGEWELMPNVKEVLANIDCLWAIASNQAAIAHCSMTYDEALELIKDIATTAFGRKPTDGAIEICPHG